MCAADLSIAPRAEIVQIYLTFSHSNKRHFLVNNHHTSSNSACRRRPKFRARTSSAEATARLSRSKSRMGRDHPRLRQIISFAKKKGIRCEFVPRSELDKLEPTIPHQGVIALASPKKYLEIGTLLEQIQAKQDDRPSPDCHVGWGARSA